MSDLSPLCTSFYWYDYETFGTHPALDRPAQFAGLRTDSELNPVGKPLLVYCSLADDYLPSPQASMITSITPETVRQLGIPENQFIAQIQAEIGRSGTCNTGYNNIRFDDEFTRYILYRNFFDPYQHEWKNNNSRWDLLDVVRLTRALRPEGINWPWHPDDSPSNRLEDLTFANGISHESAHDALSDVHATIAVARLLKEKQPRLFAYSYSNRRKDQCSLLLNTRDPKPLIHVSGMYPSSQSHLAIVAPVAQHPDNRNGIIVFDLQHDPEELGQLALEGDAGALKIARRMFTKTEDLAPSETRLPLKTVHINRAPVVVPLTTLRPQDEERLGISKARCLAHFEKLQKLPPITQTLASAIRQHTFSASSDSDAMLYSGGFFSADDRDRFERIRQSNPADLANWTGLFDDPRADEMLFRYRARNYPETLNDMELQDWKRRCVEVLTSEERGTPLTLKAYFKTIERIDWPDSAIGHSLHRYGELLQNRYLE